MAANTTTTKTSKTSLPAALVKAMKGEGTRRNVRLIVVHDESFSVSAWNTRWDGGTRNLYCGYSFGSDMLVTFDAAENGSIVLQEGCAIVVFSHFQGKPCDPTIYVRNIDLPAFFGIKLPEEFVNMPSSVVADWCDEQADEKSETRQAKKEEKELRVVAAMVRELAGVTA